MKNTSAAMFLKHIFSVLCSMTKTKSMAIRDTTNVLKARLVVLSLLKNKKFSLRTIPAKIHAILGQQDRKRGDEDEERSNAFRSTYNASEQSSKKSTQMDGHGGDDRDYYSYYYNDSNDRYMVDQLTPSLFEREDEDDESDLGDPSGSVIDLVRNNKEAAGGSGDNQEDFKLEDEINQVADLFILKFHKRMRLQKLESFKRFQEMLQRGT